jgi:hypothetical protein
MPWEYAFRKRIGAHKLFGRRMTLTMLMFATLLVLGPFVAVVATEGTHVSSNGVFSRTINPPPVVSSCGHGVLDDKKR